MITIREADSQDYPLIQQIAHQTWPHTFQSILSGEQIAYMLEMMYSTTALTTQTEKLGHVFLLAQQDTGYVGYVSYELHYKGTPKTKIHKIYILPEAQGKGIGKLLIFRVAEIAQAAQDTTLILHVNRDNVAVQVYQKLGFVLTGQENIDIGSGFVMEDYVMEMALP